MSFRFCFSDVSFHSLMFSHPTLCPSEHLVQGAIDDMLARGKDNEGGSMTVLIVAHRLSTVRDADNIFVVQGGQVVEEGRHDDLLLHDGAYAQLIRRQMEASSKLENGK